MEADDLIEKRVWGGGEDQDRTRDEVLCVEHIHWLESNDKNHLHEVQRSQVAN